MHVPLYSRLILILSWPDRKEVTHKTPRPTLSHRLCSTSTYYIHIWEIHSGIKQILSLGKFSVEYEEGRLRIRLSQVDA